MKMRTLGAISAAVLGMALGASGAKADSIEITSAAASGPTGGLWQYTYTLELTAPNQLDSNSLFVMFDVFGLVTGDATHPIVAPADWAITTEATTATITASNGTATPSHDFAGALNIRLNHDSTVLQAPTPPGTNAILGTLSYWSTSAPGGFDSLNAIGVDTNLTNGTTPGNTNYNSDSTLGPSSVPVPAAAWMGLSTLSGLGIFSLLRKRR